MSDTGKNDPVDSAIPDGTEDGYEAEQTAATAAVELPEEIREAVPEWDDEYLDKVSDRLMYNYDLERDRQVHGEQWDMYGEMRVVNQKQFFHPALKYADHEAKEYLFVRRDSRPTVTDLRRLVDLGHDIADDEIVADEEHFGTDLTFVLVADDLSEDVVDFVSGFRERELLKFGYYGHYDINLVVISPDDEEAVASEAADVAEAFTLWDDVTKQEEGFLSRFAKRFWK